MRKFYSIIIVLITTVNAMQAQDKEAPRLDLLKAPSSPAAQLLGFAVSEIDKPTDLSAFMLSIQSASSAFSKLPNSYAVDLAPFLLAKNDTTVTLTGENSLQSTDIWTVFKQSMVVSLAFRNPDTVVGNFLPANTYSALGIKFSIKRPNFSITNQIILQKLSGDATELTKLMKSERSIKSIQDSFMLEKSREIAAIDVIKKANKRLTAIEIGDIINLTRKDTQSELYRIQQRIEAILKKTNALAANSEKAQEIRARMKTLASEFDAKRVGFSWDIAGGLGLNFRDKRFDNSKVYNSGIWTTAGWTFNKGGSILGVARLMLNPDQIYALDNAANPFVANINTFDTGARYVLSSKRFGCSLEGIYRSIVNTSSAQSSWRVVFNTDYTIAPNQKLLFAFGRNFDGTITKSNNLIASLSVLFGFGGTKI